MPTAQTPPTMPLSGGTLNPTNRERTKWVKRRTRFWRSLGFNREQARRCAEADYTERDVIHADGS